jgi:hypothetical protein
MVAVDMSKPNPAAAVTMTREELYALVWAEPISHLCKRFGISDQGLAKICKRLNVPRPKQGHWNKLAAGKAVETIALPASSAKDDQSVTISRTPPEDDLDPKTREQLDEVRSRLAPVRITQRLAKPHPIIAGWIATRERQVARREQAFRPRNTGYGVFQPFSEQERRRLRLLDGLVKALEAHNITVSKGERRELAATLGREKIEFQLRIKFRQVKRPLTDADPSWVRTAGKDYKLEHEETEAQIFEIDTWLPGGLRRSWQDTRTKSLESMADDIATTIIAAFPLMAAARICREEAERLRKAEEQRQYQLKQQQKLERNRFRRFVEHADHWREAQLARAFVAAIRATIKDPDAVIDGRPAHEWLAWADGFAAQLDPLSSPSRIFQSVAQVHNWTYRD